MTAVRRALAAVLLAVPFGFGTIRAIQTGHDLRYLWVALATLCGAAAERFLARSRGRPAALASAIAGVMTATAFGLAAAWLVGTRLGLGALVVAGGFAVCHAAGLLLWRR